MSSLQHLHALLALQMPMLPELMMTHNRGATLHSMLQPGSHLGPSSSNACNAADVEWYRQAFLKPGAATATINYYRYVSCGMVVQSWLMLLCWLYWQHHWLYWQHHWLYLLYWQHHWLYFLYWQHHWLYLLYWQHHWLYWLYWQHHWLYWQHLQHHWARLRHHS
jgi:hypothetical protein